MRTVLLDTNAYRFLLAGDKVVGEYVKKADIVLMSLIVLGELYASFKGGARELKNKKILDEFLKLNNVKTVPLTQKTPVIYGKILSSLYKRGKPIPTNDIWIASSAIETSSTLVTYDRHFLEIPKLKTWPELERKRNKAQ